MALKSIVVCLFLFLANIVMAQDFPFVIITANRPNGIVKHNVSRADSIKIDLLTQKGMKIQWQEPDSAINIFDKALKESNILNYSYGAAVALICKGKTEVGRGRFKESMQNYKAAYSYILNSPYKDWLLTTMYIDIGASYSFQDNYELAFKYYYAVLQFMLKQKNPDRYNMVMVYNNIADVLKRMEQYDKAAYYLDKGEQLMLEYKQKDIYGYIWVNKADLAMTLNNIPEYRAYLQKAIQIGKLYNLLDVIQSAYLLEGDYYMKTNQPNKAIASLKRAVDTKFPIYSYYSVIAPYYTLGFAYYQSGQYDNAEKALLMALTKANNLSIDNDMLKAFHTLSAICEKTNRYQQALTYQKSYVILKDSLQNKEKLSMANELEIKFRTAEKDKELANKKLQIAKQNRNIERKNLLATGAITGLLVVVFISVILYRNFGIRNKIIVLKAKIEGEEVERSRIARDLHDGLGGMLAVLKMKFSSNAGNNKYEEDILNLLNETSEEIRKTAYNLMPDSINNLSIEEAISSYVETINRSENNLKIDLQVNTKITAKDASFKLSLYRVIQEIIQNIVKHSEASFAVIQIFKQSSKLHMLIEDNGIGFDYNQVKKGLGLTNLETRVKMLNGKILFNSKPGRGTTINIELN